MKEPTPGSFSEEVQQFLAAANAGSSCAGDLRAHAPRLDRRLGALERERSAIVTALLELPVAGGRAVLGRIRALVKAENQAVFDCYWHDLGGEGGA